ncbi:MULTISPECIES: hypothetical protein [unclassified Leucobacter]|uniref:hypothetical protein n=1 Tax=unclassified Leucobacter TaxID=2621730 RepID=UPI000621A1DA|nr:hypothetical protein [Leucobacter sp. Ag1]KKI22228.1 hypothetical protein XM48_02560 [Leucobacter sp. Ag1]
MVAEEPAADARGAARLPRWPERLALAVLVASIVELLVLIAVDGWLPDGLVLLLVNLVVLGALASGARRGAREPIPGADPARAPIGTRFATAVLGWCLGALVVLLAAAPDARAAQLAFAGPLLLLAIPAPWEFCFPRAGTRWGRRHWIALGIADAAVLVAAVLVPHSGGAAAPLAFGLGVAATLPLIAVAFLRPLGEVGSAPGAEPETGAETDPSAGG